VQIHTASKNRGKSPKKENTDIMKEKTKLLIIAAGFLAAYYVPWDHEAIRRSGLEAFLMLQGYARQLVLTCLIPAFFIAVFVSQASVLKYFGAQANKFLSYSVALISGMALAVCSCWRVRRCRSLPCSH